MGEKLDLSQLFTGAAEEEEPKIQYEEINESLAHYEVRVLSRLEQLAMAVEDVYQLILENPDQTFDGLYRQFLTQAGNLELTPDEMEDVERIIEKYREKHFAVEDYRNRYPDDKDLYTAIFGIYPKGEVEVVKGPMTLYFSCNDIVDYARIYAGKFRSHEGVSEKDMQIASHSGGVSIGAAPVEELKGTLIAENNPRGFVDQKILDHEVQHAMHRLFYRPISDAKYEYLCENETDPEKRERLMRQYFRYRREEVGEHRAADEIFSYKKNGKWNDEIVEILTQPRDEGGLYDYFHDEIDSLRSRYGDTPETNKVLEEVFVTEYQKLLKEALAAFDAVKEYSELTLQETTWLLSFVAPRHWEKYARRRKKFEIREQFGGSSLVEEDPTWKRFDCVAEEFDQIAKRRPKQKNKKAGLKNK